MGARQKISRMLNKVEIDFSRLNAQCSDFRVPQCSDFRLPFPRDEESPEATQQRAVVLQIPRGPSFCSPSNNDCCVRFCSRVQDVSDELGPILDWFENNYIGMEEAIEEVNGRRPAVFPPEVWNVYERVLNDQGRTNA